MRWKILFFLVVVLSFNFVSADVILGNVSHEIEDVYGPGDVLKGWMNVSFIGESFDSLIRGFGDEVKLGDFFLDNGYDCSSSSECSCFPLDCRARYDEKGVSKESDSFSLGFLDGKVYGVRIVGNVSDINNFEFNITSNSGNSCFSPLMVDVFDDGDIDFRSLEVSEELCSGEKPYGCYDEGDLIGQTPITTSALCQTINLPPARGFKIGAVINGSGNANFDMILNVVGGGSCSLGVTGGGDKSCIIILDDLLSDSAEAEVCISAEGGNVNEYKINFEDTDTCGYTEDNGNRFEHDFEIYAKPLKFKGISGVEINEDLFDESNSLKGNVENYLDSRFNSACDPECIIPIRILSGVSQEISLKDLVLEYKANGLTQSPINSFYELDKIPATISSDFLKLDLEKAEISVSDDVGEEDLVLRIGDEKIEETVLIKDVPRIRSVIPQKPALHTPTNFIVVMEGLEDNVTYHYLWDFGDGNIKTSLENSIEHTYTSKEDYKLIVNVSSESGEVSKSFDIEVISPYLSINETIKQYRDDLSKVEEKLGGFPTDVSEEINKIKDLDGLKSSIDRLEKEYQETFESEEEELIKIMGDLVLLDVPIDIGEGQIVNPSRFVQSEDRLDINVLSDKFDLSINEDESKYYEAINHWLFDNIDIGFEYKTYVIYYDVGSEVLLSNVKMTLSPYRDVEEIYMVVDDDVEFLDDYGERDFDGSFGIRFSEILEGEPKTIEFIVQDSVDFVNPPIYVSPEFRNLEFSFEPGVCNYNRDCEEGLGETYKNCRYDCKPVGLTLLWLLVLIVVALIVYIFLQEGYKRYYERHLFKNNNQLFNLLAFMRNAENSGLKKGEIFGKLKPHGWTNEQLEYGWKKLHGKRTGMWEIPIFKPFEKKKVKEELDKRRGVGVGKVGKGMTGGAGSKMIAKNNVNADRKKKGFFSRLKFWKKK